MGRPKAASSASSFPESARSPRNYKRTGSVSGRLPTTGCPWCRAPALGEDGHGIVARKVVLYGRFPVRKWIRRFVQASESVEAVEARFCEFLDSGTSASGPEPNHNAKKTIATFSATPLANGLAVPRPYFG